jgi:hypothetical protein
MQEAPQLLDKPVELVEHHDEMPAVSGFKILSL